MDAELRKAIEAAHEAIDDVVSMVRHQEYVSPGDRQEVHDLLNAALRAVAEAQRQADRKACVQATPIAHFDPRDVNIANLCVITIGRTPLIVDEEEKP